jgi:hypothetical protein
LVEKSLPRLQDLVFADFNHLSEFPLFFVQLGILLLFLAELRCRLEQRLEVLALALVLEEVNFGQKLLLLLL